jgi:hypothetical protein
VVVAEISEIKKHLQKKNEENRQYDIFVEDVHRADYLRLMEFLELDAL